MAALRYSSPSLWRPFAIGDPRYGVPQSLPSRQPRLRSAPLPAGDYIISTSHVPPIAARSSGKAANDRQPSLNVACLARLTCIV